MAKTYIDGTSCKAVNGQFGEFFNISINMDKLSQYANEKGYVNMTLSKRKEPGQYGDTHYFTLNEWTPESRWDSEGTPQTGKTTPQKSEKSLPQYKEDEISIEDLPF
jgi:hypothetical protein